MRNTLKVADAGGCTAKNISAGRKRDNEEGKKPNVSGTDNNKTGNVQATDRDNSTAVPPEKNRATKRIIQKECPNPTAVQSKEARLK